MSRTYSKFPSVSSGRSGWQHDKQRSQRRFRRLVRMMLGAGDSESLPVSQRELSDVWTFSFDGPKRVRQEDIDWPGHEYKFYIK